MASDVDFCNLALGHLGDEANVQAISPPDGTAQAQHCARFYSIALDATLEMHAWGFATHRATLAQLANESSAAWPYQYAVPADIIKPLAIYPADEAYSYEAMDLDDNKQPFKREGDKLLTTTENAMLTYIMRVTDPTRFTPMFGVTFSYMLASYLAGPIIKGTTGANVAKELRKTATEYLAHATSSDANAGNYKPDHTPDWLSARGNGVRNAKHATNWRR